MQFKENQTIYLQIAERISDEILLGHYAILVEVNANTVMRSYEFLQTQSIIFNKRGIGFFVSPDAKIKIKSYRRNEFLKNELQRFFIQIYPLNISMEEIDLMYKQFIDKLNSKTSNAQL